MTDVIDYNSDLEYLLKIHAEECESFSILHRYSFEKYSERSNYINIPVIILSSAIGFATGIDIGYDKMNIILGVSSIFVGIIKSIDTYFQLGKRSESHRICSLQFHQINKKIMIELSLKRDQRISAKDMLQIIKTDIKNLQDIAPLIDEEIIEIFKKNYGVMDPSSNKIKFSAHTPNLCNGLSQVTINGEISLNDEHEGGAGRNRRRRRRRSNSRGSRGSRGSRESNDDFSDDSDDNNGGSGGSYSRNNKRNSGNNGNNGNDGNVSAGSASSGFINSVSNLFHKGVNLIKGSTPPPPEPESRLHNRGSRHSSSSNKHGSHGSHGSHGKNKNSVIELTSVVVDGANNNEVQEIISNSLPTDKSNTSVKSTPLLTNNNSSTTNLVLTEAHLQQLQMLQMLQEKQQQQQQPPQQKQQVQQLPTPPLQQIIQIPSRPPSSISHHSQQSFNPVNFTNTISAPSLLASAEFVFTNTNNTMIVPPSNTNAISTPGNMSQRASRPQSIAGSTHNSVIGSNTPRNLGDTETETPNQVIEVHEIETPVASQPVENLQINLNNIPLEDDDNSALM
jgi:hypothetical protein